MTAPKPCRQCGTDVDPLDVFPGGICLECYRPTGERLHAEMTGERLARMWGAR